AFVDRVLLLTVVLGEVIAGVRMMRVRERLLLGRSRRGPLLEQRGDQRARGPAMTQPNRPAVRERCRHEADGHERAAQEADKGKTDKKMAHAAPPLEVEAPILIEPRTRSYCG